MPAKNTTACGELLSIRARRANQNQIMKLKQREEANEEIGGVNYKHTAFADWKYRNFQQRYQFGGADRTAHAGIAQG